MDEQLVMEPIVLIDKPKRKEAHIVVNIHNSFEEVLESARKINTGLFEGDWQLSYIDKATKQIKAIDKNSEVKDFITDEVDTFYWNYQKPNFRATFSKENRRRERFERRQRRYQERRNRWKQGKNINSTFERINGEPVAGGGVLTYANMGKRILAWCIDLLVIGAIMAFFRNGFIAMVGAWLYFAIMESSHYQGTLGKILLGLKVADLNGRPIDFAKATIRHFAKYLSNILMLGYLLAFFTEKNQALHDLLAACIVVEDDDALLDGVIV